jgi:hypothetical protein
MPMLYNNRIDIYGFVKSLEKTISSPILSQHQFDWIKPRLIEWLKSEYQKEGIFSENATSVCEIEYDKKLSELMEECPYAD